MYSLVLCNIWDINVIFRERQKGYGYRNIHQSTFSETTAIYDTIRNDRIMVLSDAAF